MVSFLDQIPRRFCLFEEGDHYFCRCANGDTIGTYPKGLGTRELKRRANQAIYFYITSFKTNGTGSGINNAPTFEGREEAKLPAHFY